MSNRDFVMARLAAAQAATRSAVDGLHEALEFFTDPSEDEDGAERSTVIEVVEYSLRTALESVQQAQNGFTDLDKADLMEAEYEDDVEEEETDAA